MRAHRRLEETLARCLVAVVAPAVWPLAAAAEEAPAARAVVVVVGQDPTSELASGRLEALAEQLLERLPGHQALRPREVLDPTYEARRARLAEGTAAIERGLALYDDLDAKGALAAFKGAQAALEGADLSGAFPAFVQAWMMKIASLVALGDPSVRWEMERLLALDPQAEFPPTYFPPEELAFAEQARSRLARGPSGLEVLTEPSGAAVYVDGKLRGPSPVRVEGLAAAEHLVTVVLPGYELHQQRLVEGRVELSLKAVPQRTAWLAALGQIAREQNGPGRGSGAADLARLTSAQQTFLATARHLAEAGTLEVVLSRHRLGVERPLATARGTVPLDETWAPAWAALLEPLLVEPPELAQDGQPPSAPFSWTHRNTGQVLLGLGAALLGTGVGLALRGNALRDEFGATPQRDPQWQGLQEEGRGYLLWADLTAAAGLLAAGTGLYLSFLAPEPAPPARASASPAEGGQTR